MSTNTNHCRVSHDPPRFLSGGSIKELERLLEPKTGDPAPMLSDGVRPTPEALEQYRQRLKVNHESREALASPQTPTKENLQLRQEPLAQEERGGFTV